MPRTHQFDPGAATEGRPYGSFEALNHIAFTQTRRSDLTSASWSVIVTLRVKVTITITRGCNGVFEPRKEMSDAASARTKSKARRGEWPTIGVSVVIFALRQRADGSHELVALLVRRDSAPFAGKWAL